MPLCAPFSASNGQNQQQTHFPATMNSSNESSDSSSLLQRAATDSIPSATPLNHDAAVRQLPHPKVYIPSTTTTSASPVGQSPSLRLQTTNLPNQTTTTSISSATTTRTSNTGEVEAAGNNDPAAGTMNGRSTSLGDMLSPGTADEPMSAVLYSPQIDSLGNMVPLPSPMIGSESPGPWNSYRGQSLSRHSSITRSTPPRYGGLGSSGLGSPAGESLENALSALHHQRKVSGPLRPTPPQFTSPPNGKFDWDQKNPNLGVPLRRNLSKHERSPSLPVTNLEAHLHREKYLAQRRRTISSSAESSPALSGSATSLSSVSSIDAALESTTESSRRQVKKLRLENFEAQTHPGGKTRKWRGIRMVGQGAFSKVFLATSEDIPEEVDNVHDEGIVIDEENFTLNPRKYVAVKVIEQGAAGRDREDQVESSLKRELEILKSVNHPCLIRLKAFHIEKHRALLVMPYCAGGDLFDVASSTHLSAPLVRRIFAECVSAVRYLHKNGIVHRDVKLENVLVNLPQAQLQALPKIPFDYPHPIITLTDLGLSKHVDFNSSDYMLSTRCGSDDYAAPELIMSQDYDGRQTDAWALGVMLYALLEERLPFDHPDSAHKMRSRTAHRIARCEWKFLKLADGAEYDPELEGGKRIISGLLKRARMRLGLEAVEEDEWVKNAITVQIQEVQEQ